MRIGLVRRGYSPTGGAEAYLRRLAAGIQQIGHQPVLIASPEWPGDQWPNAEIIRVPARGPVGFARAVERANHQCDVIFSLERILACDVYRAGDGVHRAWLDRRAAFDSEWQVWWRQFNLKHRALEALEAKVLDPARTRTVIVNSRMVRDEIRRHYDFPANRIALIRNGLDPVPVPDGTRERVRAEYELGPDRMVAVFVGSGWERKGLRFAVEAVRALPTVDLLVAGEGKWKEKNDLPTNVRLLGPVADIPALLAAADIFVLPTLYDPASNACLEALAAGLPVITTSANGLAEILTERRHGSVTKPGDTEALRRAIAHWANRDRLTTARTPCRRLAAEYPVARNVTETLDALLEGFGVEGLKV